MKFHVSSEIVCLFLFYFFENQTLKVCFTLGEVNLTEGATKTC